MSRSPRRVLCGILIAGGAASTAVAATPEAGTVSVDSPKITWAGEVTGSWFPSRAVIAENAAGQDGRTPCEAPTCDSFKLTVADQKDLTLGADGPGEASDPDQIIIRVKKPDGSYLTTIGDGSAGKPLTVKFKNAAKGDYVIDYWNYYFDGPVEYNGFAQLAVPAPAPAPGGTDTTVAGTGQQAPPATGPAANENIDVQVKVGKTSARKLKKSRKLTATVTVSRQVATVSAFLRRGTKLVAKGRRGSTSGTAKLTLKLSKKAAKKLRKGTYTLTAVADDGRGTTGSKTIRVKVRK